MLHVTWTEWKNMFSIEVYCRTAKLQVDGLVRSYGAQRLRIYRMGRSSARRRSRNATYGTEDLSWAAEWEHFAAVIEPAHRLLGDLGDAATRGPRGGRLRVVAPAYAEVTAAPVADR